MPDSQSTQVMKRLWRYTYRVLACFVGFVILYGLAAWLLPRIAINRNYAATQNGIPIFVSSNGVHTDLVVPVRSRIVDWTAKVPYADFASVDSSYEYVSFGWGDKGFYLNTPTWGDLKFSTAFVAVFFLGSTAMHVTYEHTPQPGAMCRRIVISEDQYRNLANYINASFQTDAGGKYRALKNPGYSSQDRFYEANGTYSFLRTCNVWTGDGLRAAGVRVGWWTPLQAGVFESLPD